MIKNIISRISAHYRRKELRKLIREVRLRRVKIEPLYDRDGYGIMRFGWWSFLLKKQEGFDNRWIVIDRFATIHSATKELQRRTKCAA